MICVMRLFFVSKIHIYGNYINFLVIKGGIKYDIF